MLRVTNAYRVCFVTAFTLPALQVSGDVFEISYSGTTPLQSGPYAPGTLFEFTGTYDTENLVSGVFADVISIDTPVMRVDGIEVVVATSGIVDPRDGRIGIEVSFDPTADEPLGVGAIRIDYFTPMPLPSDLAGLTINDVNATFRDQTVPPPGELPFDLASYSVVLVPSPWSGGVMLAAGLAGTRRRR